MRKKIVVSLMICVVIGGVLTLYLRERSTVLYSESQSKQWSACIIKAYGDPKKTWDGYVFYKGDGETPKKIFLTAIIDGEKIHNKQIFERSDKGNCSIEQKIVLLEDFNALYPFLAYYTEKPTTVELVIQWQENGTLKEENILLQ